MKKLFNIKGTLVFAESIQEALILLALNSKTTKTKSHD
jgi:hypothetical protein